MRVAIATAVLGMVWAASVQAQEATQGAPQGGVQVTIPDQVVTATRVPTLAQNVPAYVTVITRQEIEDKGYNSLMDALSDVPGVHVGPSGGLGGQASVFIRGTDSDHVLVLRDGMPITDASDPTGAYNFGTDTLSDIERIEIIQGPMAALYGSGAIGGVINLISRRGTQQGVHWEGDIAGGYPALVRGAVSATGMEGPVDFAITAESQSDRGYDYWPQRESSYTGTPDSFRDRIFTMNLGYTPIEGTRLSLFLRGDINDFGYDTLGTPTYDYSNSTGQTSSLLGRIGGSTTLFNGFWESSAYLGQLQDDRHYTETLAPLDPNQNSFDDRYHSYRTDVQWNNTLHLDQLATLPGLSASALTFGYEYTGDSAKVRANESFGGFPYMENVSAFQADTAIYLGLQTMLLKRLTLTAQIRQDWVLDDSPTTWRTGLDYDLKELLTHLKVSYGTGFRAPSLFDRYGLDSYGYVGNPNLKPEEGEGWDAGFTTTLPAFGRADFADFGPTYFDERIRNLIESNVTATTDSEINVASAHVHGVEFDAALHPFRWLDLHATYTFLDTASDGQPGGLPSWLLRRPENEGSADVTVKPIPALKIITTMTYTGAAYDYLYDNNSNFLGVGVGQHGLVTNVAANYAWNPHVVFYLDGNNIFYSKYEPVNGYQIPGPTVLAGVRLKL